MILLNSEKQYVCMHSGRRRRRTDGELRRRRRGRKRGSRKITIRV
jgi:hypothetical protein